MQFHNYLIKHWPPVVNGKLIKSPSSRGNRSNHWTQYLEYRIQEWCIEHKYYWVRELECKEPRKKLDYGIIRRDPIKYYFPKTRIDWSILVEAEWDQGKYEKFIKGDFMKLVKYPSNKKLTKIVIVNTKGGAKGWKDKHEEIRRAMKRRASKDISHYFVLMTCNYSVKRQKYIGWSICDDWGKLQPQYPQKA